MDKVLVIDDEPEMTALLHHALSREGYDVDVAFDGRTGLRKARSFDPDVVLLDVMMPEMSGWETLHALREFSQVPVIMLTAVTGEEPTVRGLNLGADDYITKPFAIQEMKARLRAVLRRATLPPSQPDGWLTFDGGRLVVDPESYKVIVRGETVELTPTEHRLLFYLAHNAGQILTPSQILTEVWGPGYEDSLASVKVYIQRLRSKIELDPQNPQYVLTHRGLGYSLAKR
jgi:DNA-binding response OmpR family regulator